jgi:hypothetical protein
MAFTYVGDLSTDLDKVRFYTHDITEDSGPLPGGGNFQDVAINAIVTSEGSWERAVAVIFDTLAAAWSHYVDITAGPHSEKLSQAADSYLELAKKWRQDHHIYAGIKAGGVIRIDGYSDDVASDDVEPTTEYAKVTIKGWDYPL